MSTNLMTDITRQGRWRRAHALLRAVTVHAPNTIPVVIDTLESLWTDHELASSTVEDLLRAADTDDALIDRLIVARERVEAENAALRSELDRERAISARWRREVEILTDRLDDMSLDSMPSRLDDELRGRMLDVIDRVEAIEAHITLGLPS